MGSELNLGFSFTGLPSRGQALLGLSEVGGAHADRWMES
jgi:hypothetical protein